MLAEYLTRIANDYANEKEKPLRGSKLADFFRNEVVAAVTKAQNPQQDKMEVRASVGIGMWATIPLISYLDPLITTSAQKGFYVALLINPTDRTFTLSMNQGAKAIVDEYGLKRGRKVLRRRAKTMAGRVSEYINAFSLEPISLGSKLIYPACYEAGHAFGKTYQAGKVDNKELIADIHQMLLAYRVLVYRGGATPMHVMQEEAGSSTVIETRNYILSRRIERSSRVRQGVLLAKPLICESCGLDPKLDYGYSGDAANTPLDVHHAAPLDGLAEGESRRYQIPEDFLVLCPSCHRVIHKQDDPSDLKELKAKLRFRILR